MSDGTTINAGLVRDNAVAANGDAAASASGSTRTLATTAVSLSGASLMWNIASLIFSILKKKRLSLPV